MNENDYIYKNDLPLHIDVTCYGCKRLAALSNTTEHDGRHYCGCCSGEIPRGAAVRQLLYDMPEIATISID